MHMDCRYVHLGLNRRVQADLQKGLDAFENEALGCKLLSAKMQEYRGRLVLMQKAREEDTTVQEEREPDAKKVKMEEM